MRNKLKLNNEIHLENIGGYYYKPFKSNGDEINGIILKDCRYLYDDGETWEMISNDSNGCIDVGPFHWDGYDLEEIGYNNFIMDYILKLSIK
jgi:hypothetical protein